MGIPTKPPLFASPRERRLWTWTLAVVLAIFATLTLAQRFATALGDGALSAVLFIVACLLVLAAIVTQGLTTRPGRFEIGVAMGVVAAYLLVFVRISISAERTHLVEYGVVAVLVYEALTERARQGRHVPAPGLLAIVATSLVGVVDESVQMALPSRVFDPVDMLFNVLAAVMAVTACAALGWARRKTKEKN